jgi:hypothetical protein
MKPTFLSIGIGGLIFVCSASRSHVGGDIGVSLQVGHTAPGINVGSITVLSFRM